MAGFAIQMCSPLNENATQRPNCTAKCTIQESRFKIHSILVSFLYSFQSQFQSQPLSTQLDSYLSDPARVTYSPTIQYLPLGLSGIVRCFVQANPSFQFITWTKDRRPFEPSTNPGVVTLNNGSLSFQRVIQENQGRYRCTPYNIHGTAGTSNVMEVLVRG